MLVSYSGSNGYPLALSKFLFNSSSHFLGNTTISRYNGYYIYPQVSVTLGSNLLQRRTQFTNPAIVKLLATGMKFYFVSLGLKAGF